MLPYMKKYSSDQQFEKTFADLAFSKLRDRAPKLLDYLIGFQVLDKEDDDTKGVGVFAFDIAGAPYYAPMFFLKGELKGSQLLYSKQADQFLPLAEKWVNYVINSKRPEIGQKSDKKVVGSSPDLDIYTTPPGTYKTASAQANRYFNDLLDKTMGQFDDLDLRKTLKLMSKEAKVKLAKSMAADEKFAEAVMEFYDVDELLKVASYEPPIYKQASTIVAELQIILPRTKVAADLTKEETNSMTRDGVVIRDFRDDTKPVFDAAMIDKPKEFATNRFMNPEPGMLIRTLMLDGSFQKSLILRSLDHRTQNNKPNDIDSLDIIVINMDSNKSEAVLTNIKNIFVPVDDMVEAKDEFMTWLDNNRGKVIKSVVEKDKKDKYPGDDTRDSYFIIDQNGSCIQASRGSWHADMKEGTVVDLRSAYGIPSIPYTSMAIDRDGINERAMWRRPDFDTVNDGLVTNGTGIKVGSTVVYIPKYCPAIRISKNQEHNEMKFGSPNILALGAILSSDYQKIKITSDGTELTVTDASGQSAPLSKSAAIIKLATKYGVNGQLASVMVNAAIKPYGRGQAKFLVKNSGFEDVNELSYDPELGVVSRKPQTNSESIDELQAGPGDSDNETQMTDKARTAAIDAANTGNKEVLDTAILSGLLNNSGATSVIDSYMKSLVAGLDRVGRIMFLYYWHDKKFRERYGSQDMRALEDSLVTVFDSMGDLILFLKEKTADVDTLLTSGNLELDGSV